MHDDAAWLRGRNRSRPRGGASDSVHHDLVLSRFRRPRLRVQCFEACFAGGLPPPRIGLRNTHFRRPPGGGAPGRRAVRWLLRPGRAPSTPRRDAPTAGQRAAPRAKRRRRAPSPLHVWVRGLPERGGDLLPERATRSANVPWRSMPRRRRSRQRFLRPPVHSRHRPQVIRGLIATRCPSNPPPRAMPQAS